MLSHSFTPFPPPAKNKPVPGENATDSTRFSLVAKVRSNCPDAASHNLMPLPDEIIRLPSGENATDELDGRLSKVSSKSPVSAFQTVNALSKLPDRIRPPSGENATAERNSSALPERPVRVRSTRPVPTSQSFTVLSLLPDRTREPSGEKATERT